MIPISTYMFTTKQRFTCTTLYIAWGALGFYRGAHSYEYRRMKHIMYRNPVEKITPMTPPARIYTHKLFTGMLGVFIYMCPFFFVVTLPKELYRFEVNMLNIEDEKKTDYYNELN
jgi:hypothetical protein